VDGVVTSKDLFAIALEADLLSLAGHRDCVGHFGFR
jgi:hypothetical protein